MASRSDNDTDLRRQYDDATSDEYTEFVDEPDEKFGEDAADTNVGGKASTLSPLYVHETRQPNGRSNIATPSKLFSHPTQDTSAEILSNIAQAIRQELDRERRAYQEIIESAVRVTTNLSGQVSFQRYGVATGYAIQIAHEKSLRGDLIIVNFTDTVSVYIGLHAGIMAAGTDTVAVVGSPYGTSRRIRTKRALWAIASAPATIDVQEEFD